jgi:protein arginine kinase activator
MFAAESMEYREVLIMKCEHCGKNEVTFVYQSNINGKVSEKHLCGECAEQLGYSKHMVSRSRRMMQDLMGDGFFGRGLFDDFFTPMPSLLGRMNRMLESPFDDFFADMPALNSAGECKQEQVLQKQEHLVSEEEQKNFSNERELNALRMEMRRVVEQENFERAAELRDQIRAMEAAVGKKSE